MVFFVSCEGDTESWYLEWLKKAINNDPRTKNKIKFSYTKATPSSFAKSNNSAFTKGMIAGSIYCRIQDIEDYSDYHMDLFKELLESKKKAQSIFRSCAFEIGYSNFTFEIWMIAHKARVKSVSHRDEYYKQINKAYSKSFKDNHDYKHKRNFDSLLKMLTLNDVIESALPECKRFRNENLINHPDKKRELYSFTYYLNDPDTTLDAFVELVLREAGVI